MNIASVYVYRKDPFFALQLRSAILNLVDRGNERFSSQVA